MSISWLNAAAFAGLALIALPVAIHLLVRQQTRIVAFPSLRFLSETALAALRRRAIQDAGLLACRVAVVVAAVLALAGPIVETASRRAGAALRVSRAIVLLDETPQAGGLVEGTFRSTTIARANIADALADAVRWLDSQPPSAREIAIVGAFRRGQLAQSDLLGVPQDIGIRLVQSTPATIAASTTTAVLTRRNGRLVRIDHTIELGPDSTRVAPANVVDVPADRIRVIAAAADQRLANAALTAAVEAGVRWTTTDRRLVVVWDGAENAPPPDEASIVRMAVPTPPESAATAVWNAIERATARELSEPVIVSAEELQSWSRSAGPPSSSAVPVDERDRRWLWAAALLLLALESWLRRESAHAERHTTQEQRVA